MLNREINNRKVSVETVREENEKTLIHKKVQLIAKRAFDVVACIVALIIFSPVLLIVAILIKTKLGSPIFFTQDRVGQNNKIFKMMKFRTMKNAFDKEGNPLPDSERMTKLGSTLRSLSLDELPELINIIKGDMSIVGPRPLLVQYLPKYSKEQIRRHNVLPGLTGWAQVNGRNSIKWSEKFTLDVWYVDNWSMLLDLKIIWMTVMTVIRKDGINQDDKVTMEYFDGSN